MVQHSWQLQRKITCFDIHREHWHASRAARHDETADRESGDRSKEGRGRDERWR